jgi:uncharacterized protein YbaR (Trm112 family)
MKPVCPNCKVEGKIMVVTYERHCHFITHIEPEGIYRAEKKGIDEHFRVTDEEFVCESCNELCELEEMSSIPVSLVQ